LSRSFPPPALLVLAPSSPTNSPLLFHGREEPCPRTLLSHSTTFLVAFFISCPSSPFPLRSKELMTMNCVFLSDYTPYLPGAGSPFFLTRSFYFWPAFLSRRMVRQCSTDLNGQDSFFFRRLPPFYDFFFFRFPNSRGMSL